MLFLYIDRCDFMDKKSKSQTILLWIVGVTIVSIVISIICLISFDNTQNVFDWISYVGSVMTLVGLAITFYQTTIVEQKAKETAESVKDQIRNTLSTIDITKAKLIVDFIIENMTTEKYEMAYYRMVELNDIMINILGDDSLKKHLNGDIDNDCRKLTTDMNTVHKFIAEKPSKYEIEIIIANLHRIRTYINEASNYINTLSYGRS